MYQSREERYESVTVVNKRKVNIRSCDILCSGRHVQSGIRSRRNNSVRDVAGFPKEDAESSNGSWRLAYGKVVKTPAFEN